MIFKIKKNLKDYVDQAPHEPHLQDPSRRDFLKRGIYASGLFVMGPSLFSLLRSETACASAFEEAYRNVGASYCMYEASGGCGFSAIAAPTNKEGKAIIDRKELGWANGSSVDVNFISGLTLNTQDEFLKTLLRGGAYTNLNGQTKNELANRSIVSEIFKNFVSGTTIAAATTDDSNQNKFLNLHLIQKMRSGSVMKSLSIGANGRSANAVFNAANEVTQGFSGTAANNINQLISSVKAPDGPANLTKTSAERVAKTIKLLSDIQSNRDFNGYIGKNNFDEKFSSSLEKNSIKFDVNYGKNLFDILSPQFSGKTPFGNNFLSPTMISDNQSYSDQERAYVAALSATHRQIAGSMYVERGGFDYHPTNDPNLGHLMHAELARFVILWAITAHAESTPSQLTIVSDGSIAWGEGNTDQGTRHVALGDRGTFHQALTFFYHPTKKVKTQPIGYFDVLGGGMSASSKSAVGKDPRMIGFSAALTFAKFSGLISNVADKSYKDLALSGGIALSDSDLNALCGVG